eukprot:TRINITY_DN7625_c0_g1_i1.p1 TRINITY_DN7625_c0_g1~~TRINITY_DN7625_c0_g1_i1.p1  ORF type:complete len:716 (+),score=115.34 TRINITY_DN7625_c0_g1_i1:723-2870(+)
MGHYPNDNICPGTLLSYTTADITDSFSLGQVLGRGAAGVVRLAEDMDDGNLFACKSISKDALKADDLAGLREEIEAMRRVGGHPNVVELHGLFEEPKAVHLVMDLCTGGDLFDYLEERRKPEAEIAFIYCQAAEALRHCHSLRVVHRDVKPENLMVAKKVKDAEGKMRPLIKLIDFGHSVRLKEGEAAIGPAGSPMYVAPEVIKEIPYGTAADMWSLGVALFTSLSGQMPFKVSSNTPQTTVHEPRYVSKTWATISLEAESLVRSLLKVNPELRPTAAEVLQHPWIQKHCSHLQFPQLFSRDVHKGRRAKDKVLHETPSNIPLGARFDDLYNASFEYPKFKDSVKSASPTLLSSGDASSDAPCNTSARRGSSAAEAALANATVVVTQQAFDVNDPFSLQAVTSNDPLSIRCPPPSPSGLGCTLCCPQSSPPLSAKALVNKLVSDRNDVLRDLPVGQQQQTQPSQAIGFGRANEKYRQNEDFDQSPFSLSQFSQSQITQSQRGIEEASCPSSFSSSYLLNTSFSSGAMSWQRSLNLTDLPFSPSSQPPPPPLLSHWSTSSCLSSSDRTSSSSSFSTAYTSSPSTNSPADNQTLHSPQTPSTPPPSLTLPKRVAACFPKSPSGFCNSKLSTSLSDGGEAVRDSPTGEPLIGSPLFGESSFGRASIEEPSPLGSVILPPLSSVSDVSLPPLSPVAGAKAPSPKRLPWMARFRRLSFSG